MSAGILNEKELTAGTIAVKGPYYYIVMSWYEQHEGECDNENKTKTAKRSKWLPTKISVKESGGKKKAKDLLLRVRIAFDKNNPDVPIGKLLSGAKDASKISNDATTASKTPAEDKGILFADYMLEWLEDVRIRVELTTFSGYQKSVCNVIVPYFKEKGIYLSEITAQDIHMFYKQMLKRRIKTETVIRYHSNIRKAIVDAVSLNSVYKVNSNVLVELKKPKKPKKPEKEMFIPNFYSVDELNEMFEAFKGHRLEIAVKLTAFYGFRREEVLGLKWSAVDFKQNTISVSHTVTQCTVDGKSIIVQKDRAKNPSSRRIMPLVDGMRESLLAHKKAIDANRKLFGKTYSKKDSEYICVREDGNLIKPGYITKNFVKVLEEHGLRRIRLHDLRHSCASLLVANGVPMKMIQEWLGHSNFSTTADRYSHLEHSQKMVSANALSNAGLRVN